MVAVVPSIEFSEDQVAAVEAIEEWRARSDEQTLTFAGFAGTGKTTVISFLVRAWPGTAVCALAGKAANVLRMKGVPATTIHSLIYEPVNDGAKVRFVLRHYLPGVKTIVVDEASMVNAQLYADLLSFGLPVLFVGDHGQLEPIGDNPNLMAAPQVRLERIHRQAANNPILRLATAFREGRFEDVPARWRSEDGRCTIGGQADFWSLIEGDSAAQFLCGYNRTRHDVNRAVRRRTGRRGLVVEGERVICLRNNRDLGIFNGQQAEVTYVGSLRGKRLWCSLRTEAGAELDDVVLRADQFGEDAIKDHRDQEVQLYDYGYCLTCHKSQGSEYDELVVMEQVGQSWDRRRWSYTAATRARETLVYCRYT